MRKRFVPLGLALALTATPASRAQDPQDQVDAPRRNIAGPGDFSLRERLIYMYGKDPRTGNARVNLVLVNGGAVFSGEVESAALKTYILQKAAIMRGVINVTDEMNVARADLDDAALRKGIQDRLASVAGDLGLDGLDLTVDDTVATLRGRVATLQARERAEELAGSVLGITRVANLLRPVDAPKASNDADLVRMVAAYLGEFQHFGLPAEITVRARKGVVTLEGRSALYLGRLKAGLLAAFVEGAQEVRNEIRVDPSLQRRDPRIERVF